MNKIYKVIGTTALVTLATAAPDALAQFSDATIRASVVATAALYDSVDGNSEFSGTDYADFFKGLSVAHSAYVPHVDGLSFAQGNASQDTDFTETEIISSASVGSDIDYYGESLSKGVASGYSSLSVEFTIEKETTWSFPDGSVSGTHAGGFVALYQGDTEIFNFDSIFMPGFSGQSGTIGPGTYSFHAEIFASSNANDGFGGLFADASFNFHFVLGAEVPPEPCAGDADGNNVVNFADITEVLTNFGTFYTPETGPGDADHNGQVNFADITEVLTNFGSECPA